MTWDRRVPFDKSGNQVNCDWGSHAVQRRPVDECAFDGELEFDSFTRGRSAFLVKMKRVNGGTFVWLSANEFFDLVPVMVNGRVSGSWAFYKQGTAFFCRRKA